MLIRATQIRPGMILQVDGGLMRVLKTTHVTPGKGQALMQTKMRNIETGSMHDVRFNSNENVEKVDLEQHEFEFLYADDELYHFMNTENYEQIAMNAEVIGDDALYLLPNIRLTVEFYDGRPISIELPLTVDMEVVETEPGMKKATASASKKPAVLETGLKVQVPQFVDTGERITVDTRTGEYMDRAK